ncbi:cytochrome P450 [Candidatus Binatus sp.]|uniref:cytochrome P450 n=1 Tax=Candidatus Binatus sp. TaxID=2811406 RepID=UPI003C826A85
MKLEQIDLTDLDFFQSGDRFEAWRIMRAEAPVYWHHKNSGEGFWSLTTMHECLAVLADAQLFSSALRGNVLNFVLNRDRAGADTGVGKMLNWTDPPRHEKIRALVNRHFGHPEVSAREPHIRRIVNSIIDTVVVRDECDFSVEVAGQLPTAVICEMMGIPRADWNPLFELGKTMLGADDLEYRKGRSSAETEAGARSRMFDYLRRLIAERRKNPGDDLVSALVTGTIAGAGLSQSELLWNALLLILGGLESLRIAITGGLHALLENPAEFARLRANPALMETAVEEMLRWTSPATHAMRSAVRDTEINGHPVLANQRVVMWFASANRDEQVFPESERFLVGRSPNNHLTFSHGNHFCIGSGVARLEMRVMFEEVLRRMSDIELAGPVEWLRTNFNCGIKHMPIKFKPRA